MELIRGFHNLHELRDANLNANGSVATLGSFDGVHRGHQAVIARVVEMARRLNLPATVITTEPLPREFFSPDTSPPRLTRFREKLLIFRQLGIERVLCLRFDSKLANLSAGDFVKQVLVDGLRVKHLIVGDDTRFGKNRQGDFALLLTAGQQFDFAVENTATLSDNSARISSTRIRDALTAGDMVVARSLLGRDYFMSGRVAHGEKRGRTLGFPTANIHLRRRQTPLMGVFAVEITGIADTRLPAVASIGVRPTFGGGRCLLEVHLLDFNRDIYGRHVDVYFLKKLRDEQRFESVDALIEQMHRDVRQAEQFFASQTRPGQRDV